MSRNPDRGLLFGASLLCLVLSGCGAMSGVYRTPLTPSPVQTTARHPTEPILLQFDQAVNGVPLNETIWDSFTGPRRDQGEANQIGFTQHRSFSAFPLLPFGTIVNYKVKTQIFVPFGNLLTQTLISSVNKPDCHVDVAYDEGSAKRISSAGQVAEQWRIKVDSFYVWEDPLNHLNYYCTVSMQVIDSGKMAGSSTFTKSSLKNDLGGVFSLSSSFLNEMNASADRFTHQVVEEILDRATQPRR